MAPAVKDVNGPKKPLSAYIAWQGAIREKTVKGMPEGYSFGDLAKKFSATWKSMSESQKAPFENKAKSQLEKYHKQLAKYKLTDDYKKFQELKAQSKVDGIRKSRFRKDENAPKRALSGYFIFMQSKKDALIAGGMVFTEASKECGALWNKLGEAGKKPWEAKAAVLKKKYEEELAKYQKTSKYKKYQEEKAVFDADKKEQLKKIKDAGKEKKAKKVKAPMRSKSKSRSRSTSRSKSRSKSRSRSKPKAKKSRSRSRSKSRSRSRKPKAAKKSSKKAKASKSKSRSRKSRSRSAKKPKAPKRAARSRSRKRSRSAKRAKKAVKSAKADKPAKTK